MKIFLHDFGAYPFTVELAETLARRGHAVVHCYCGSLPTTPNAITNDTLKHGAAQNLAIHLSSPIQKGAFFRRFALEREYGAKLAEAIKCEKPDIVVMGNTPLDSLLVIQPAIKQVGASFVIWVQDLLGEAALKLLPKKIGAAGKLIGQYYRYQEGRLFARADHLIPITDDFSPAFRRAGIPPERWTTIPNWAPLSAIKLEVKNNSWAQEHGLSGKFVFLYSGTLGFKHNPELLLALARALAQRKNAIVVVNSEGEVARWLQEASDAEGLSQYLQINGFQPFARISETLASADVLLSILEPDASEFSVPSKVLTNLCAGRAQLLAVPENNLAAKLVHENQAGLICDPIDQAQFIAHALTLLDSVETGQAMGRRAREFALSEFCIDRIADRFESVFLEAITVTRRRRQPL